MYRIPKWNVLAVLLSLVALSVAGTAARARLDAGTAHTILSLPAGHSPEGIALTRDGTLLVGDRLDTGTAVVNRILRVDRDSEPAVFATLPSSSPGAQGLLGLATDPTGAVYAALTSFDGNHGVWRISADGSRQLRLDGSGQITFPNALAFDAIGNLYVTDSFRGAIWRSARGGPFAIWLEDPLLAPLLSDPLGIPLPGANGIVFSPPNVIYVANTEQGLIARITVDHDGRPASIAAVTSFFATPTVDGIALDALGNIYAAIPGFALLQTAPIMVVDSATGDVRPLVIQPSDASRFDTPLSLAFGRGRWDVRSLMVTNGDVPVVPGGPGPGVVQVDVGVPGFPFP